MTFIRHLRHPVKSAATLYERSKYRVYRIIHNPQMLRIRRGSRKRCWCGSPLELFAWHPSYGVCANCGCYVNQRPPLAEELSRIYSFQFYWHRRQKYKGLPPIENRADIDRADGRMDYWMKLLERYAPPKGRVIEVGCAHAVFLELVRKRGYECIGVEPDPETVNWARRSTGLDIRAGLFPEINLPDCDLFMAFDVIEHTPDPHKFLIAAARLLKPGGIVILQTPINRYEFSPPFGEKFIDAFDDVEHLFLFTNTAMRRLAELSGLRVLNDEERLWLHHEVCILQKPEF